MEINDKTKWDTQSEIIVGYNYEIVEENKGPIGTPPTTISKEFDENNEETFILWGQFLLKNTFIN